MFLMSVLIFLILCCLLFFIQISLTAVWKQEEHSLVPLESGFESIKKSNLFSSPFTMLAMLFVLFDVELILLLPSLFTYGFLLSESSLWLAVVLLMSSTLFVEWLWSGLKWSTSYFGGLAQ